MDAISRTNSLVTSAGTAAAPKPQNPETQRFEERPELQQAQSRESRPQPSPPPQREAEATRVTLSQAQEIQANTADRNAKPEEMYKAVSSLG